MGDTGAEAKLFLEPRSVALVGVSRQVGEEPAHILQNLVQYGFPGAIYPVNPHSSEIMGVRAYPRVGQIPAAVDLAVITVGRGQVVPLVAECVEAGIKAITVVAQGFADAGAEGAAMQQEMVRIARSAGARIIGPNTFGTANAFHHFSTSYRGVEMDHTPIGIICQSGFFYIGRRDFKFLGKGIDLGNACDVDFADALEYYEFDPQVRVIAMHMEGLRDGRRFMQVARRVARRKPVLLLKSGRSGQGARSAASHTGALTGRDEVYGAMVRQTGLIRVEDLDDLEDTGRAFLQLPLPRGGSLAVLTVTGAGGTIAADACDRYGMTVARLAPHTLGEVARLLPDWCAAGNPLDYWSAVMISGHSFRDVFRGNLEAVLADDCVDAVLAIGPAFPHLKNRDVSDIIARLAAQHPDKPIVFWAYSPRLGQEMDRLHATGRTAVYPTADRAIRALSRLVQRSRFLQETGGQAREFVEGARAGYAGAVSS